MFIIILYNRKTANDGEIRAMKTAKRGDKRAFSEVSSLYMLYPTSI